MRAPLKDFPASQGFIPFVYGDKPAGHRAAWTCKWVTARGVIQPGDWGGFEEMGDLQLMSELQDLHARGVNGAGEQIAGYRRNDAIKYLRRERERYPEFIYWLDPPERGYNIHFRPGWGEAPVKNAWKPLEEKR